MMNFAKTLHCAYKTSVLFLVHYNHFSLKWESIFRENGRINGIFIRIWHQFRDSVHLSLSSSLHKRGGDRRFRTTREQLAAETRAGGAGPAIFRAKTAAALPYAPNRWGVVTAGHVCATARGQ